MNIYDKNFILCFASDRYKNTYFTHLDERAEQQKNMLK